MKTLKILCFFIALTTSCFAQESFKYFFKSIKQIEAPRLKTVSSDETYTTQWFWKLDGSVSLLTYQYVGGSTGVEVNWLNMAGIGVSYQKIKIVDGKNWSDLTLKALLEIPTPTASTQTIGGCLGVFLWNNVVGITIGYKGGYKYPFAGLAGSWNF